jgi:hypothetical protein
MVCGQVQEASLWYEARLSRAEVQLAPFRHSFQQYYLGRKATSQNGDGFTEKRNYRFQ